MSTTPLLPPKALQTALQDPDADILVADCSFDLADAQAGRRAYDRSHIPGAIYISLDDTLSGAKTGRNGRHPLPEPVTFAHAMAMLGINAGTLVVAYDNSGGMYAARLWWMLRWAGHSQAAVLDGGFAAWKADGCPVAGTPTPARAPGNFALGDALVGTVHRDDVLANIGSGEKLVIDARAADRFRGENETLDPVGGHIPGAVNRLFRNNLMPDGRFKPAHQLREEFRSLVGDRPASTLVNQCGSGVTACHNLLAMDIAGLTGALLYPGSWSEWCAQPDAPIEKSA